MSTSRSRVVGWTLVGIGLIGIVTGAVPFATNAIRIIAREDLLKAADLIAHGVEAMGLSTEWAMLSSAMGTFLGSLMVWAGVGWIRGRGWAPLVTWTYVFCGLAVNATDTIIFAFRAKHGPMRSLMLAADGVALLIPIVVAVWLMRKGFRVSSSEFRVRARAAQVRGLTLRAPDTTALDSRTSQCRTHRARHGDR